MSRTWKKYPYDIVRKPRGRRRALIEQARKKAIPPDDWEDIEFDKQCYTPQKAAERMVKDNVPKNKAIKAIAYKFKLSYAKSEEIFNSVDKNEI